jgi:hypothetical protein
VTPGRLAGIVAAVCGVEAAAVAVAAGPGVRLRLLVDIWTWQALLLGLAGAFLVADRPFLAAREMARRLKGDADDGTGAAVSKTATRSRRDRSFGAATLALGVALFAAAALAWELGTR